ncbi:MAG: hypothetical protein ACXADY_02795 [Candidatus Hodarchaeales archaeon]
MTSHPHRITQSTDHKVVIPLRSAHRIWNEFATTDSKGRLLSTILVFRWTLGMINERLYLS